MRELFGSQQGDAWFQHRTGRITASKMNDLMSYNQPTAAEKKAGIEQGKESAKRRNYRFALLAERLTQQMQRNYVSPAMEYGQQAEDEAKQAYELATGEMLIPVGFVLHPTFDWAGASPDALLPDAVYESKSPESTTFLEWYFSKDVPEEHVNQIQWQMACTGMSHGVFHARDVRQPSAIRNIIRFLDRDSALICQLESEAEKMNAEVEAMIQELGLPPTVWNTKGDEEIHVPEQQWPADLTAEAYAWIDGSEMVP